MVIADFGTATVGPAEWNSASVCLGWIKSTARPVTTV